MCSGVATGCCLWIDGSIWTPSYGRSAAPIVPGAAGAPRVAERRSSMSKKRGSGRERVQPHQPGQPAARAARGCRARRRCRSGGRARRGRRPGQVGAQRGGTPGRSRGSSRSSRPSTFSASSRSPSAGAARRRPRTRARCAARSRAHGGRVSAGPAPRQAGAALQLGVQRRPRPGDPGLSRLSRASGPAVQASSRRTSTPTSRNQATGVTRRQASRCARRAAERACRPPAAGPRKVVVLHRGHLPALGGRTVS